MSEQSLRDALEKLVEQKDAEPDRRPRDKYGPIGRKPEPAVRVSALRDLLAAHPVEPARDCPENPGGGHNKVTALDGDGEPLGYMHCGYCGQRQYSWTELFGMDPGYLKDATPAEPAGVSDEAVERAKVAGLKALLVDNGWHKSDGSGVWRANYKRAVELVISAALPHLQPQPVASRDQIAEVLREHDGYGCGCCASYDFDKHEDRAEATADAVLNLLGGAS